MLTLLPDTLAQIALFTDNDVDNCSENVSPDAVLSHFGALWLFTWFGATNFPDASCTSFPSFTSAFGL